VRDRNQRFHDDGPVSSSGRSASQRDRDRILYTTALRRLAEITQVTSPTERHVPHNRLTHTLKVAQIGRRLAEQLIRQPGGPERSAEIGGLDPEVVEAAALAHDLGHPPFGHVAEHELDRLATNARANDGFNGNAQSFRIVTRLAVRDENMVGLNLTRATLNAILKYPWNRATTGVKAGKWGAYHTEDAEFTWARLSLPQDQRSLEAELMDWADDVTYAVHDLEDFYRAGLIPLDRLASNPSERSSFLADVFRRRKGTLEFSEDQLEEAFSEAIDISPLFEPYRGTRRQGAALRVLSSNLISHYASAVSLAQPGANGSKVEIEDRARKQVTMLKELTWHYVINNPLLASQQFGQREVIRKLFEIYHSATRSADEWRLFPPDYQGDLQEARTDEDRVRVVVDLIASMTEIQASETYRRLMGLSPGSVMVGDYR
jgi:dGTPase